MIEVYIPLGVLVGGTFTWLLHIERRLSRIEGKVDILCNHISGLVKKFGFDDRSN